MNEERYTHRARRMTLLLLFSFLLFISSVWVVFDELFAPFSDDTQTVTVPDYLGMDADGVVGEEWLEIEREYRYDAQTPAGTVMSQSPTGGSQRKISAEHPTCQLTLTVSLGQETATLPNVVGMDVRVAETTLRALGFAVKTEVSTGAHPEGEVFEMEPRGGVELPLGSEIRLFASAGTPAVTVTVPSLCGLTRGEALTRVWLSQLSVLDVVEIDSDAPAGTVVRQNYQPGTIVMAGTRLTLYVSREWEE